MYYKLLLLCTLICGLICAVGCRRSDPQNTSDARDHATATGGAGENKSARPGAPAGNIPQFHATVLGEGPEFEKLLAEQYQDLPFSGIWVAELRGVYFPQDKYKGTFQGSGHMTDGHLARLVIYTDVTRVDLPVVPHITDAGLAALAKMLQLKDVTLPRHITDEGLAHISNLDQLERLNLHSTTITDGGVEKLARLTNLRELHLSSTPITDAALVHLAGMKNLETLILGGCQITDAGLENLAMLRNLQTLELSATKITDAGLRHLAGLDKLRSVTLHYTAITEGGAKKLKQARPRATIVSQFGTF